MMDMMWGSAVVGILGYILLKSKEANFRSGVSGLLLKSLIKWVEFFYIKGIREGDVGVAFIDE
jgi:hypothetical protein